MALEAIGGFSVGYSFGLAKKKEDEVRQGKNYYLSGMMQWVQAVSLGTVADKFADMIPPGPWHITAKVFSNVAPILAAPVLLFAANVKQGGYKELAAAWNQRCFIKIPTQLNGRVKAICNFIAEHSGDIFRAVLVVSVVALAVLGHYVWAAVAVVSLTYSVLDSYGIIPRKVSLFMEKYLPIVSVVGMAVTGNVVAQVFATIHIASIVFSHFWQKLEGKVDGLLHKMGWLSGHSMESLEGPLVKPSLSYEEIKAILQAPSSDFRTNPAHYTKGMHHLDLPEDKDFSQLLTFFDEIAWDPAIVKGKLRDDDRFIDHLATELPSFSKEELWEKLAFEQALETLAKKENKTAGEYAIAWTREQMNILVKTLKGEVALKGQQVDLDDAISSYSKILPLLKTKRANPNDRITYEDSILSLAIEGGAYCGRGLKGVSDHQLTDLIATEEESDPAISYENKLYAALIRQRILIIQNIYNGVIARLLPTVIANDVHTFDVYRTLLSYGFTPVTKSERNQLSPIAWWIYSTIRTIFYGGYENELVGKSFRWDKNSPDIVEDLPPPYLLGDVFNSIGEVHLAPYLARKIQNSSMSDEQKEELIETYIVRIRSLPASLDAEEVQGRLRRLALVMSGMLQYKGSIEKTSAGSLLQQAA